VRGNWFRKAAHDEDPLRVLLRREIKEASEAAVAADGRVSAEQLVQLEHLSRLVEFAGATRPPPPARRWVLVTVLFATLVVVSVLLFARVVETEIELDLVLDEVGFVLTDHQVLTDVISLSVVGVSGLQAIELPGVSGERELPTGDEFGAASSFRVAAGSNGARTGEVSLAPLALPAQSRVSVQHTGVAYGYRLSLEAPDLALQIGVRGPVQIGGAGSPPTLRDYATPRSVLLRSPAGPVDVDLRLKEVPRQIFHPQLESSGLSFSRIHEFPDAETTLVRHVSTIRSGILYLEELGGRAVPLRPGEALHFDDVRGQIRTLELREDDIVLKFRGQVRGMHTGWGNARRSLMPTYLEWLRERHGLALLWGSTLYLFGIVVGLMRWWGIRL
jgi:hypothetical protein